MGWVSWYTQTNGEASITENILEKKNDLILLVKTESHTLSLASAFSYNLAKISLKEFFQRDNNDKEF